MRLKMFKKEAENNSTCLSLSLSHTLSLYVTFSLSLSSLPFYLPVCSTCLSLSSLITCLSPYLFSIPSSDMCMCVFKKTLSSYQVSPSSNSPILRQHYHPKKRKKENLRKFLCIWCSLINITTT